MVSTNEAIDYMKGVLESFKPKYKSSSGNQYAIRCPYCGDSVKHDTSTHFYIKTSADIETGLALFSYQCKLCDKHNKIMDMKTLNKLNINFPQLVDYIYDINKNFGRQVKHVSNGGLSPKLEFKNVDNVPEKVQYLKNRLGDCDIVKNPKKYKIILNLREFFITNRLKPNTQYKNARRLLNEMHEKGIGTLSYDNTFIEFRDYTNTLKNRYTNYSIYSNKSNSSSAYVIPTKLNILNPKIKIVLTEGVYDILRVYSDFYKDKKKADLFVAVHNSHGYIPTLKRLMRLGIMYDEIEIYSDSDVELWFYKYKLKPHFPTSNISVFYNTKSKDVGDITKPLKLKRYTI